MEDLVGGASGDVGSAPGTTNTMDDLMGIFGSNPGASTSAAPDAGDLMNGFGGLSMDGGTQQAPSGQKKTNVDILGLF
jgi:AP-1 complex subunit beta-1